jgi:hypothetical protein
MRDRLALLLLLLPALVISMGARRSEPMYIPPPIEIPRGAKADDVSKAIKAALLGRVVAGPSEGAEPPERAAPPEGAGPGPGKAFKVATLGRGWSIDKENVSESGGVSEIVATLYVRVHTVTIRFEFDDERIQIHYVTSTNMGYVEKKNDEKLIHPKYTQWLKNLEFDLKSELQRLRS